MTAVAKQSISENMKIVGIIVGILSVGVTVGIFSQRMNVVEAKTVELSGKVEQINAINTHLATIDSNLSNLSKQLLKYDVTITK